MKIIAKRSIDSLSLFEKIKREIKTLKIFNHPHIVKVYEFFDTPSHIYVIMEYQSGGELFECISRTSKVSAIDSISSRKDEPINHCPLH